MPQPDDPATGAAPPADAHGGLLLPGREAHFRHLDLLRDAGTVAWEMDARTWRFTFVSPHAVPVFGYPLERWYEEPTFWQDVLLHPDDREWCVGYCSTASAECRDHAFHYRARRADGSGLWVKDVVKVIPDELGHPSRMRGIMVDVTPQIRRAGTRPRAEKLNYHAPELERYRIVLTGEWWDASSGAERSRIALSEEADVVDPGA